MLKHVILCVLLVLVFLLVISTHGCQPQSEPVKPTPATEPEQTQVTPSETAVEHHERGITLTKEGRYEEAISEFSKAIELDPNMVGAFIDRAVTYGMMGQFDLAIADCSKAIELDSKLAIAYLNRSSAYMGKEQFDLAVADCSKAIELDPNMAEAYANRGLAYTCLSRDTEAQQDIDRAVELGIDRLSLEIMVQQVKQIR